MLTNEQVKEILSNMNTECAEDSESEYDGVKYYLSEHEEEGWMSEGKWETNYFIYELVKGENFEPTGIFIGQGKSRSGSYYSEYCYDYEGFEIVEQIEKTVVVKEWVVKRN